LVLAQALGVMYQQVVPVETGTRDGWSTAEASMRAVPVVVMEPARKVRRAFLRSIVGASVGPLAERRLNETLCFAVRAGRVGSRANVFDLVALTDRAKCSGLITGPIVGEQSAHLDTKFGVPSQGHFQNSRRRNSFFVASDLRESNARVIVNGHVDVLPSSIPDVLVAVAVNAVADAAEAAQFLNVQMQQVTRARMLVAHRRRRRIEITETTDPLALQDAANGGRAETRRASNAAASPTLATEYFHLLDQRRRGGPVKTVGTRTAIVESREAAGLITANPFGSGARTDLELGCSRVQGQSLRHDGLHQRLSTTKGKSGILMDVHSISRFDVIAQHNQHLRFWSNGQPVERSHLVGRCGAQGGEVIITDNDKQEMDRFTMREPGECYVFDDDRIWHMLTPVAVLEGNQYAYRDTLAFDMLPKGWEPVE